MTSVSGYGCCYSKTTKCFNYNHSFSSHSNSTVCKNWRRRVICFSLEESEQIKPLHCHQQGENYGSFVEKENGVTRKQALVQGRRQLLSFVSSSVGFGLLTAGVSAAPTSNFADMPALRGKDYGKTKMRYPDYTLTDSGLQYKDLRTGAGPTAKLGGLGWLHDRIPTVAYLRLGIRLKVDLLRAVKKSSSSLE